uniref:Meiosis 5 n=1 Tax=Oryza meridionalis TaxID=40149 RepID=A0A0E0BYR3_9ORYZ
MKKNTMGCAFLLAAFAMAAAFVPVAESRTTPVEKTTTTQAEDGVKKPDCVPAFDPRSFPGHGGTTTPTPIPGHHGGGGGSSGATPSHGGGGGPSGGALPSPSHGGAAPSHGGGYGASPPVTPSPGGGYGGGSPAPSHGGGAYGSSPSTPSGGGSSPTPSHGGGAYGGGGSPATPASHDEHGLIPTSPGTCDYWRSHPMEMWSALGRWPSSVGHFFGSGSGAGAGGAGTGMSIQDALANTRGDGAGELMREAAAALLNSMTRSGFPYTAEQVRDAFAAAAAGGSDGAAAAQAATFKKANEGGRA